MARLQILELPEGTGDDRPPFVLVVDQVDGELAEDIARWPDDIAKRIGARQVLCFPGTVDIPANDVSAYVSGSLPADAHYEVTVNGQPVTWPPSDEAQARAAEGLRLAHERTDIARDMDRLANHKAAITDALGINPLNGWDRIIEAAATLRQDRDEQAAAIARVRNLHRPVEHRGQTICWECSAYDFPGLTTDNAPVTYDQCHTLKALDGRSERSPED
ncbi:hypothetical protein ABT099_26110 [Streptomyces prasinus]|uniref:hypothetical protein n=1 Tax=Streptomyces prasinus TaxID=67345 RepID=UPI0033239946